ncbi:MAG: Na(+)-translocating NADH-quinone reductase subunit A [Candidatus Hydrogenedentota bacterium]
MGHHVIKKGLDLPITGEPEQRIEEAAPVSRVAVMAADYPGMRPSFQVKVDDEVKRGQVLFENKKQPGILHTAPGAGRVVGIHRGDRRALQSVVIELNEAERTGNPGDADFQPFDAYTQKDPALLDRDQVTALLIESGMWTAIKARPFAKNPPVSEKPHAIFITALDTEPLAAQADVVAQGREEDLRVGALVVAKLTDGTTYWCTRQDTKTRPPANAGIEIETFAGPHPAGLPGTHIHLLDPVHRAKSVWYLHLQDVLDMGALFRTGRLPVERVVSLCGPQVVKPRLLRTRLGAWLDELIAGELKEGENRVISGSVLSGRIASGEVHGYLGRYARHISVVREGREREFLGWLGAGTDKFSITRAFASALNRSKRFDFTTTTYGSPRAMVPIGMYEQVMPHDILPTYLLRAMVVNDIERAEQLGCLELDEEDMALCTFVSPGKTEYGPILRRNLDIIEKEG